MRKGSIIGEWGDYLAIQMNFRTKYEKKTDKDDKEGQFSSDNEQATQASQHRLH